jgi:hypothetical protein
MNSKTFLITVLYTLCALSWVTQAADVTGKWKNTMTNQNGETREFIFNLKQSGTTVTGNVITPQGDELPISEGKIDPSGNLSFSTRIERDGNTVDIRSTAKLSDDSLKGKTEFPNRDGEKQTHEWVAKREAKAKDLSGTWNSSFTIQDGTKLEGDLRLKQDGSKLTGALSFNDNETEIKEGKIEGENVSFKLLRDRDGRTVTSKYQGKLQSNGEIKGFIDSDWTGEVKRLDWEAKRKP